MRAMNKKKMIYWTLIVLLAVFVLFTYNEFNGNPISKFAARQVLDQYLEEQYPNREFRITESFYNFKFKEYSFNTVEIGSTDQAGKGPLQYRFSVRGFFQPTVSEDELRYSMLDEKMMERLSREAEEELSQELGRQLQNILEINVNLEVLQGQFPEDISWSKDLMLEEPMYIFIMLESTETGPEEFLQEARLIQDALNTKGYTYSHVNINGKFSVAGAKDERGYLRYAIGFEQDSVLSLRDVSEYNQ